MIEIAIRDLLIDKFPEIANKVFYSSVPQSQSLPYIVVNVTDKDVNRRQNTRAWRSAVFEIACYHSNTLNAAEISETIISEIDGFSGVATDHKIIKAHIVNEYDDEETQTGSFVRVLTLNINYI